MNILVTGATGQLGSKIVQHILEQKTDETLFVSVRNVEKAAALKEQGVEVRHGDFDDPASLDEAFSNVDRLVLVSTDGDTPTRIRQHQTAIEAAKKAGVKLIVYTSLTKANEGLLNLAEVHKDTEQRLIESGIDYKILRNNWYLENEVDGLKQAIASGVLNTTYGAGQVGWLLRDEYAQAAAGAVLGKGETNQIFTLSNTLGTVDDLVKAASEVTGKAIQVNHIQDSEYAAALEAAGLPKEAISFVVEMNKGIREGGLAATSDDYEILTGKKPQTLVESLSSLLKEG